MPSSPTAWKTEMFDIVPAFGPLLLDRARILGIVNATPDSFSDGSAYDPVAHGMKLVEEGADALDVGGESTRPGATPISLEDELARVIPVIEELNKRIEVPISIDTSRAEVMRAAIAAGASIINDVRALQGEGALEAAAAARVPVILMHMQGEPGTMQDAPRYDDVVAEVHRFLAQRIFACEMSGIEKKNLAIDPGFGFGKTLEHNLALLRGLAKFTDLGVPVLAGLSRKGMIGTLTGRALHERGAGSAAAALIAVQNGAKLVRVHDVAATRDALAVWHGVGREEARRAEKRGGSMLFGDD
jgi:dihydropteroate synthase